MLNAKKILYILPDLAYYSELFSGKKPHEFQLKKFIQLNGELFDGKEIQEDKVDVLLSKFSDQAEAIDLVLADYIFTNTIINVEADSQKEIDQYVEEEVLSKLHINEDKFQIKHFVLTKHRGTSKVQFSALQNKIVEPLSELAKSNNIKVKNIYPLSWTVKSMVSLEPSLFVVELGGNLYLSQHYIGLDQCHYRSSLEVEKLVKTVETLKGSQPGIQTLYCLTSDRIAKKFKKELSAVLPIQNMQDEDIESEKLPAYVKQFIENGCKTINIKDYQVPSFSVTPLPVTSKSNETDDSDETVEKQASQVETNTVDAKETTEQRVKAEADNQKEKKEVVKPEVEKKEGDEEVGEDENLEKEVDSTITSSAVSSDSNLPAPEMPAKKEDQPEKSKEKDDTTDLESKKESLGINQEIDDHEDQDKTELEKKEEKEFQDLDEASTEEIKEHLSKIKHQITSVKKAEILHADEESVDLTTLVQSQEVSMQKGDDKESAEKTDTIKEKDDDEVTKNDFDVSVVDSELISDQEDEEKDSKVGAQEKVVEAGTIQDDEEESEKKTKKKVKAKKKRKIIRNNDGLGSTFKVIFFGLASFLVTIAVVASILFFVVNKEPGDGDSKMPDAQVTPEVSPTAKPTKTPTPTPKPEVEKEDLKILVVNATTISGYAGRIKQVLVNNEIEDVDARNARGDYEKGTYVLMEDENETLVEMLSETTKLDLEYLDEKENEDPNDEYDAVIVLAK